MKLASNLSSTVYIMPLHYVPKFVVLTLAVLGWFVAHGQRQVQIHITECRGVEEHIRDKIAIPTVTRIVH